MSIEDKIRALLEYDPVSGVLRWREGADRGKGHGRRRPGHEAGYRRADGYRLLSIDLKRVFAHRIAFLLMTGSWPLAEIDHRDGNPNNNRWANLREATRVQNNHNVRPHCDGPGVLGISFHRKARRWNARIQSEGKQTYLGLYDTPEEAHAAYCAAKARLHPFQPVPRD